MQKYTLKQLQELTGCELAGDPSHLIEGVNDLEAATNNEASFLENPRYETKMALSQAGVIFAHPSVKRFEGKNYLLSEHPSLAFQKAIELFIQTPESDFRGIHKTACIGQNVTLGENVIVGPYAVIDRDVVIGDGTVVGPHVVIGAKVTIGNDCRLHAHATIHQGTLVGARVVIQSGAVIGSCGFGYFTDARGKHHPLKQLGIVILEDDVDIGAGTTVDRARFKTTRIKRGTKIDNLVQIAHGVQVGQDNLIVSQTGIAGSSKTGNNVVLAGQVGIVGHIEIADQVILAARSAAIKSILKSGIYSGAPATPIREFNEQMALVRNIRKLADRVRNLEKELLASQQSVDRDKG